MFRGVSRLFAGAPDVKQPAKEQPPAIEEEEVLPDWDGAAVAALTKPAAKPLPAPSWTAPVATGVARLDIGAATSPGQVRSRNEDSYLVQQLSWANREQRQEVALVVVADGLGGHQAGDLASGLVIRTVGASLAALLGGALSGQVKDPTAATLAHALQAGVREANRAVHQKSQAEAGCRGMGATVAAVLLWDGLVQIGHVGDCRVYHVRAGKLSQVTRDQTLVARMVELGQLTPEQALTHPSRNEVTQALGAYADLTPAAYELKLATGDWLVVACDGLHAHVDSRTLEDAVNRSAPSAAVLAHELIDQANEGGGSDNCTVVAIRCY